MVEVDSTYYALPSENTSGLWVSRTPASFVFDIKAFRLFTQHPASPGVLPKDIRERLSWPLRLKRSIYHRDLPPEAVGEMWARFESALLPLDSAGKLGVVLFQFPPWFFHGNQQLDYIALCQEGLSQYRVAVEFRHGSWVNEKNRESTLAFLRGRGITFVCVDEPQGFKSSLPPIVEATSDIGVVRFHGRNRETWEKEGLTSAERFDYLYSEDELREWIPGVRTLAAMTEQVHVLFNNCHGHKATSNAGQIKAMLD